MIVGDSFICYFFNIFKWFVYVFFFKIVNFRLVVFSYFCLVIIVNFNIFLGWGNYVFDFVKMIYIFFRVLYIFE